MDFDSLLVLIGGGHASGKKTAAKSLKQELQKTYASLDIQLIDMEKYLKSEPAINSSQYSSSKSIAITVNGISDNEFPPLKPSRFDFDALKRDLKSLLSKQGSIIIVHGLYALYDKEIRDMSKIKVFISSDADTRLIRWIKRDVVEKGDGLASVINHYLQGARAEMSDFINPTKEFSDVIMPTGPETSSINLLVDGITPYISKMEPNVDHLRSNDFMYGKDKISYYELT